MYEVCAKCGHVGKNYYVDKTFAVVANSGKEAALIARSIPRVKHHHADAIRYVEKIDEERYNEIRQLNSVDPYFLCTNIQQQREFCDLDIMPEVAESGFGDDGFKNYKPKYYGKKVLRNPKKYINNYAVEERYTSWVN